MNSLRNYDFGTYLAWKKKVKFKNWQHKLLRWRGSCIMYGNLSYYRKVMTDIKMNIWWKLTGKLPIMIRMISGVLALLMGSQPSGLCVKTTNLCMICRND